MGRRGVRSTEVRWQPLCRGTRSLSRQTSRSDTCAGWDVVVAGYVEIVDDIDELVALADPFFLRAGRTALVVSQPGGAGDRSPPRTDDDLVSRRIILHTSRPPMNADRWAGARRTAWAAGARATRSTTGRHQRVVTDGEAGMDGPATDAVLRMGRFFRSGEVSSDARALYQIGGREADTFYRDRWCHDKVVRSTHGVNCTGSCSWKVYVKDGIITWESQQTDYPSVGPDQPGVRAARLPARGGVLLVHLLAHPGPLPLRAWGAAGDVPGGARPGSATRCRLGATSSDDPERRQALQVRPRQGRIRAGRLGRGGRDGRRRPRAHHQDLRARTGSPGSRRSPRCRWSATPPARGSSR